MRAEIGQLTLDRTLAERAYLNKNIVNAINSAAGEWGIQCLRYEIRKVSSASCFLCHRIRRVINANYLNRWHSSSKECDWIHASTSICWKNQTSSNFRIWRYVDGNDISASLLQRHAAVFTTSTLKLPSFRPGSRQAAINVAEGQKQSKILASEGQKAENINQATGEAQAILLRAEATAKGLETIAKAIGQDQGSDAVSMSIAEKYVHAFGQMAKESTTLIVPATANDAASLVTQVCRKKGKEE